MTLREIYDHKGIDGLIEALEPIYADLTTPTEPATLPTSDTEEEAEEEKE